MGKFALLVHERVSTQRFVVLIIGNSKSNHLGVQGTFKGSLLSLSKVSTCSALSLASRCCATMASGSKVIRLVSLVCLRLVPVQP